MKQLLLILFIFSGLSLSAQIRIQGTVTDKNTEGLPGTNIFINGTYDGASAGTDGTFVFSTGETGLVTISVSSMGFKSQEIAVNLDTLASKLNIVLKEAFRELDAVVITAGSFNGSDKSRQVVLKPLDIATTAGATADIAGALNTLPGTQRVGETGRLFVRGGEGRETLTFIDGMQVLNSYSPTAPNTPSRNRFSPFMFKGTSFSTGAYSAEYGQALSSALVLESKDMLGSDRTDIGLMTVGADLSRTYTKDNFSAAGKLQYTNLAAYFALVNQDIDWHKAPVSVNGNFLVRTKTSDTGLLKVYATVHRDEMQLTRRDPFTEDTSEKLAIRNNYLYLNTNYREMLDEKTGLLAGISFTGNQDVLSRNADQLGGGTREYNSNGLHLKAKLDRQLTEKISLAAGTESFIRSYGVTLRADDLADTQEGELMVNVAFAEVEAYLSNKVVLKPGIRASYNSLGEQVAVMPRFSSALKLTDNSQFSLGFGKFQQLADDEILLQQEKPETEKATHFLANYQHISANRTFRVEAYLKTYDDLIKYEQDGITHRGEGFARGVDVFWRDAKTFRNVDYWVSYSFLDTRRNYRDFPGSYTPTFASAHNFSFVYKHFISSLKSQVGITYSFASARPYHDPNREGFNQGRTPAYHDLSVNVAYLFRNNIIFYTSVSNVPGTQQIFGYQYGETPGADGRFARTAITPPAERFIFLGMFITLSKEKALNQLPNL